jgi:GNAT superfamily N-acetyltransferase
MSKLPEPVESASILRYPKPEVILRAARYADMEGILQTLLRALAESETGYPEPDQPYCQQATMDLMAQGLVFVAANGERIVGVVILDYARWPWTHPNSESGRHLYNQHFWVDPAFRRGGTALKLRKMAEARADALGLPLLLQTSSLDSNTDLKDRFFAMGGFKRVGGNFYRMPKKG